MKCIITLVTSFTCYIQDLILDYSNNAKIKVQFIENNQIMSAGNMKEMDNSVDEVENVEYLEDEEYTPTQLVSEHKQKDSFYPNAIHCLIALYRKKYHEMQGKSSKVLSAMTLWDDIAKEMNESYFIFNREQVRMKYTELRRKYFSVANVDEIDAFGYFDQLHEIYQDKIIDAIATGDFQRLPKEKCSKRPIYRDEIFHSQSGPLEGAISSSNREPCERNIKHNYSTRSAKEADNVEIITHKEHKMIDVVGELQAMEDGNAKETLQLQPSERVTISEPESKHSLEGNNTQLQTNVQTIFIKREHSDSEISNGGTCNKRSKLEASAKVNDTHTENSDQRHNQDCNKILPSVMASREMTFAEYNVQQERRHKEKMEIMRQSLKLQECTIQLQHQLLEQLIKRL